MFVSLNTGDFIFQQSNILFIFQCEELGIEIRCRFMAHWEILHQNEWITKGKKFTAENRCSFIEFSSLLVTEYLKFYWYIVVYMFE